MKILLLCCTLLCFLACSYRVGNLHRSIPDNHELIAVPTFKNSTMEAGLEQFFTNSMLKELVRADFVRVVPQKRATAVLEGTIVSIKYEELGLLSNDTKSELPINTVLNSSYDAKLVVDLKLRRVKDGVVVWSGQFSGVRNLRAAQIGSSGFNSANPNYDYSGKQYTVNEMSKTMMAEAYTRLTEGF